MKSTVNKIILIILFLGCSFADATDKNLITTAEHGDAQAQFSLGRAYYYGKGVPQFHTLAANWYRKAAEQGHPDAQYYLALMYKQGEGVPQDDIQAYVWFSIAAANENKNALKKRDMAAKNLSQYQLKIARDQINDLYKKGITK